MRGLARRVEGPPICRASRSSAALLVVCELAGPGGRGVDGKSEPVGIVVHVVPTVADVICIVATTSVHRKRVQVGQSGVCECQVEAWDVGAADCRRETSHGRGRSRERQVNQGDDKDGQHRPRWREWAPAAATRPHAGGYRALQSRWFGPPCVCSRKVPWAAPRERESKHRGKYRKIPRRGLWNLFCGASVVTAAAPL